MSVSLKKAVIIFNVFLFIKSVYAQDFDQKTIEKYEKSAEFASDTRVCAEIINKGAIEYLQYAFNDFQLAGLNKNELRLLRNIIYAQYGYIFKDKNLTEWYGKFAWYEPVSKNVDDKLNANDKNNIKRIACFEQAGEKKQAVGVKPEELVGLWHIMPMVASGWAERYHFYDNGLFEYHSNQMDGGARLLGLYGKYKIKGNYLILEISSMILLEGGKIVPPYASYGSDFVIEDGKIENKELLPPMILRLPLLDFVLDDLNGESGYSLYRLTMGSNNFWRISANPYEAE